MCALSNKTSNLIRRLENVACFVVESQIGAALLHVFIEAYIRRQGKLM